MDRQRAFFFVELPAEPFIRLVGDVSRFIQETDSHRNAAGEAFHLADKRLEQGLQVRLGVGDSEKTMGNFESPSFLLIPITRFRR